MLNPWGVPNIIGCHFAPRSCKKTRATRPDFAGRQRGLTKGLPLFLGQPVRDDGLYALAICCDLRDRTSWPAGVSDAILARRSFGSAVRAISFLRACESRPETL